MTKANFFSYAALTAALFAAAACKPPHDSAYFNKGTPESLLDVSSEVVNLSVADPQELKQLSSWVADDRPTRAELYCSDGDIRCNEARRILDRHGISTTMVPSPQYSVTLIYERILARDCNPRYVENSSNNWNTHYASFGCSVAANAVQQVSDKQQFINPSLMDVPRATSAVQAYERGTAPRQQPVQSYQIQDSLTSAARSR